MIIENDMSFGRDPDQMVMSMDRRSFGKQLKSAVKKILIPMFLQKKNGVTSQMEMREVVFLKEPDHD